MTYKVIIREEAQADAQEAYEYYEHQRTGLGEEFLMALIRRYDDLSEHPTHYSYIDEQSEKILRDAGIERFPYVVVFEITAEDVIVYAVHNTHKHQRGKLRKT
jgi:plasmid stabilization system protein ParE